MTETTTPHGHRRREKGTALPVVLAMSIGVSALAMAYSQRAVREQNRHDHYRYGTEALYEAMGQVEIVANLINTSTYGVGGRNEAVSLALGRADNQFVDKDGNLTGVTVVEQGGADSGILEIISEATVRGETRRVSAMVRERQSFADFNYFVHSHDLGISGGEESQFPFPDAPEGSIHSNKKLVFYFPNRHFRDAVTAVQGFEFTAGATGPDHDDGLNQHFHGAVNDATNEINGLTDVDPESFKTRADNLLTLDGEWDYADVWLAFDQIRVDHREKTHYEDQVTDNWTENFHYEWKDVQEPVYKNVWNDNPGILHTEKVYKNEPVWTYKWVNTQEWVETGVGGDIGGAGGEGSTGYWATVKVKEWYWKDNSVYDYTKTWYEPGWVQVLDSYKTVNKKVKVSDGWVNNPTVKRVKISDHLVETHWLPAKGTVYVRGNIEMEAASTSKNGHNWHVLDGSVTLASGADVVIKDTIVYGRKDPDGALQTAYLNGDDPDSDYVPNHLYTGSSVLGLLAANKIEYRSNMPSNAEINATLLAKSGQVAVDGVKILSDGTVEEESSGSFVKPSLRRLGGIISNRRPVSAFVNTENVITRGFAAGKSVFDRRQLTNPPRGFPAIDRPRLVAYLFREVD